MDLDLDYSPSPTTSNTSSSFSIGSKKRKKNNLCDELLQKVSNRLDQSSLDKDECSVIAQNVANKLRKLPSDKINIADKLLTDLLFEVQYGNVNQFTRVNLYDCRGNRIIYN